MTLATNNLKVETSVESRPSGEINSSEDTDLIGCDSLYQLRISLIHIGNIYGTTLKNHLLEQGAIFHIMHNTVFYLK